MGRTAQANDLTSMVKSTKLRSDQTIRFIHQTENH